MNYSRCVRVDPWGRKKIYKKIGRADCSAEKCIEDTCSHQTLSDLDPVLAERNPDLKACIVEYGRGNTRTGRRKGLRSIKKAALCGLDRKEAAKRLQRYTKKRGIERRTKAARTLQRSKFTKKIKERVAVKSRAAKKIQKLVRSKKKDARL